MDYLSFLLCLLLAWIAIHLFLSIAKTNQKTNPTKLPPGPSPWPIFGNLFSLGPKPHISLAQLANTYGPLMTLQLGQVPTVVISSAAMAKEALHKNDSVLCNRMVVDAIRACDHYKNSVAWLPVSQKWRNLRKICSTQVFSASRLEASQNLRRNKVNELVLYVEKCREDGVAVDIGQAAFITTLNLLTNTFFSVDLGDPGSEVAREFKEMMRSVMDEAGKPNLADYFPILRKMDPQGIRRRMSIHFGKMIELFNNMIHQRLEGNGSSGSIQDSDVLDGLLGIDQKKAEEIELSHIPYLLLDLFAAGTETTSSTLEWAMAELVRNPEKLKKAQSELREIIGKDKRIEEPDIAQLPYLQAVVKETLRLHPAVPLLLPRKAESDVKLCGCTVPNNTQVLVNVWAIGRDPNTWENPDSFEPERFLGSEIDVKGHYFELIPFGAGRRICPGLPMAIRMLPLMLSSLIHGFDWKLENGVSPKKMDMEEKFGITLAKAQPLRAIPVHLQ